MPRRMYRYQIMADDHPASFSLSSDPVAVAGGDRYMEFWAEDDTDRPAVTRVFQVFGTGHKLPANATYVGTAPRTQLGLVWHLYEIHDDLAASDAR